LEDRIGDTPAPVERVEHGDAVDGPFLYALDQLNRPLVDECVEDRRVAGRGIKEYILNARRLELLDEERAASAGHFAHRSLRRRCLGRPSERRQGLRHGLRRHSAYAKRGQARHELSARNPLVEILLDQVFHRFLQHRLLGKAYHLAAGEQGGPAWWPRVERAPVVWSSFGYTSIRLGPKALGVEVVGCLPMRNSGASRRRVGARRDA
jgi:hypothetical protein